MKVLITGATGFIGRALAHAIEAGGHEVVGLTRQIPPMPSRGRRYLQLDLNDAAATARLRQEGPFDALVHAAAVISNRVGTVMSDYTSNESMTRNLLGVFATVRPRQLLYVGSVDVYGAPVGVLSERSPIAPATQYAASKIAAEIACRDWCQAAGVQLKIARFTQIFGPGDPTGKFIPNCLCAAKSGQPLPLFGDGEDRRDYLFVHDAGRLVAAWLGNDGGPDTLNFVTGQSRSMNEVLELVRAMAVRPLQVERLARKKARQDFEFDDSALRRTLGPYELTPMASALQATYDSLV